MSVCSLATTLSCASNLALFSASTYCSSEGSQFTACSNGATIQTVSAGTFCYGCVEITVSATSGSTDLTSSTASKSLASPTGSTSFIASRTPTASSTGSNASIPSPSGSNSPTPSPSGGKVSSGAAAGIGIGCAFIGAVLAGLLVFLLFRRKRSQAVSPRRHLPPSGTGPGEKYAMVATSKAVRGGVMTNVDHLLPQPDEDNELVVGLSKIRDGIKNHVLNYYHNGPVSREVVDEGRLVELSKATGIPTSAIANLLLNPATRLSVIRLLLGQFITSRCSGQTDGQPSFLPNEVSLLVASHTGTSQAALFSKWKTISGVLLQQQYGQYLGENDPRSGSIQQNLAAVDPVLQPFISPSADRNARGRNLEGIMGRAAQFAFLLFRQPSSFAFDCSGTGQPDSLLVFPAFLQTVNDEAEVQSPPRVLVDKEVVLL